MTSEQSQSETYLDVAQSIARRLIESARWEEDQCSWEIEESRPIGSEQTKSLIRLAGGELYRGSSGIALFLTELYNLTRDESVRKTAEGALRHATAYAMDCADHSFGVYSGRVGVAHALVRHWEVTGESAVLGTLSSVLAPLSGNESNDAIGDVIGGAAGAIPVLLRIGAVTHLESATGMARKLGDWLVASARYGIDGCSWNTSVPYNLQGLTGLAHGAAGYGHALLELAFATNEARYRYVAEQAFAYERSVFVQDQDNWPDFRHFGVTEWLDSPEKIRLFKEKLRSGFVPEVPNRSCMVAWCHGAPGIGLSRLRAHALLGDRRYLDEAATAARATMASLHRGDNYSLCHGAAGNCEFLIQAAAELGDSSLFDAVIEIATSGARTYELAGRRWPSGAIERGPDPSLLLGDAGIGHFYLRLHDPSVPSVLLFQGPSPSSPVPSARPSISLAQAHADLFFSSTRKNFSRLGKTIDLAPNCETPVRATACVVQDVLNQADGDERAYLVDASAVDLARFRMSLSVTDFTSEYIGRLARVAWNELARDALLMFNYANGLVRTRWCWDSWEEHSPMPEHSASTYLLFRRDNEIHSRLIGEFAGMVLSVLNNPRPLSDIVTLVLGMRMSDQEDHAALSAMVIDQVRRAYEGGVIAVVPNSTTVD